MGTTVPSVKCQVSTMSASNKKENSTMLAAEDWEHLMDSSSALGFGQVPRIRMGLRGIEAEAQRLASKSNKHIPANQLKDFAAKAGVNIQKQKSYIASIGSAAASLSALDMSMSGN